MSAAWEAGSTRRWRKVRAFVLTRDGGHCRIRLDGTCIGTATHAHHLHGRGRCADCAADDPAHIVAACAPCNLKVGDPGRAAAQPTIERITTW